jgi:hypothetical protein
MRQVLGEKKRGDAPCGEERGSKAFIEDEFVNAEEDEQFPLRDSLDLFSCLVLFLSFSLSSSLLSICFLFTRKRKRKGETTARARGRESGAKPTTGKRPSSLSQLRLCNISFLSLFNPSLPLSLALFLDLVDICLGFQSRKKTLFAKEETALG